MQICAVLLQKTVSHINVMDGGFGWDHIADVELYLAGGEVNQISNVVVSGPSDAPTRPAVHAGQC